jgi:uncharacterized protein YjeT (DUF2065 family)
VTRDLLLGFGVVAVVEGLVLALAPDRLEALVEALRRVGRDRLRLVGLVAVSLGVAMIWLARL